MPYCQQCGQPATYTIPDNDSRERLVCTSTNCGYIHYDNPKVVTGVLAVHNDKILLCRRAIEPRLGYWTLPAGFMELGETMAQGGLRETIEEAEATAINAQLYCLLEVPNLGQIHVMYLANLQDGAFGVGAESLECRLFEIDELPWHEISFRTVAMTLRYYAEDVAKFGADWGRYAIKQAVIDDGKTC